MSLSVGSITVHPTTGAVTGSGYVRALYDAEALATLVFIGVPLLSGDLDDQIDALAAAAGGSVTSAVKAAWRTEFLANRLAVANKCVAIAIATVTLIGTGTAGGDPVV